jgi:hypothetical protein
LCQTKNQPLYLPPSDDTQNVNLIPRKSLADEVASQLQEKLLKGGYKVNQKLPVEAELMRNFARWPAHCTRSG